METVCHCGKTVSRRRKFCAECNQQERQKRWDAIQDRQWGGTMPEEAKQKSSIRMKEHRAAIRSWDKSQLPDWLNEDFYRAKIQPALTKMSARELAEAIGVRPGYVSGMKR